MNVVVFGAGAIGGYLGGRLALAGHRVTLVDRPATATAINANGLTITQSGATQIAPLRAVGRLAEAFDGPPPELIVLGMKAYDLAAAVAELAAVCPQPATLLTTQNGIGVEEIVAAPFGAERVLAGTLTIPISRVGATELAVERAGRGLAIAPVAAGRAVAEWVALFAAADIRTGALADYRAMKWSKAFLNVMGNATSAILNRPPAELYRRDDVFDLEMRMLREMLAVMKRLGLRVVNLPTASVRPLAATLAYAPRFLRRIVFTQVIVHGRGDKMPSFHIDLAGGKGRSEVAFHNGAIAAAARAGGLAAPVNAALNDVLLRLTADEAARAEFDGRPERLLAEVARHERGG
jgi:2-dehydropantoate 2-reductase